MQGCSAVPKCQAVWTGPAMCSTSSCTHSTHSSPCLNCSHTCHQKCNTRSPLPCIFQVVSWCIHRSCRQGEGVDSTALCHSPVCTHKDPCQAPGSCWSSLVHCLQRL